MSKPELRVDGEAIDLEMVDTSGSKSSFVPMRDSDSPDTTLSASNITPTRKIESRAKRRGAGPRTIEGKIRSKQNSTKHGIFSKVVLLNAEPRNEFESLLNGLHNDLGPIGTLEIVFVDKLAALLWRQRRLLIAEGAEIRKGREYVEWDEARAHERAAARISSGTLNHNGGLVREIANPNVLQRCLELLEKLKSGIDRDGFDIEWDKPILTMLYGEFREDDWRDTLFHSYLYWIAEGECPDRSAQSQEKASIEKCENQFLIELDKEVERLKRQKKELTSMESGRLKLESLSRSLPDVVQLDRFLRYGASLDREINRLLRQLERFQQRRLGQPLPAQIEVSVSSDE